MGFMALRSSMVFGLASAMIVLLSMAAACGEPAPAPDPDLVPFASPAPTTYYVGDGSGWRLTNDHDPSYLRRWAESKTFYVGDALQFEYDPEHHNVVQTQGEKSHIMESLCSHDLDDKDITIYNSGNDSIILDQPGFYSFVSEFDKDCIDGLHIVLQVLPTTPMMSDQDSLYRYRPRPYYYRPRPYYYYYHPHPYYYFYQPHSSSPDHPHSSSPASSPAAVSSAPSPAAVFAYPLIGMLAIIWLAAGAA